MRTSAIALGSWLTYGQAVDREAAADCIAAAIDAGINHFDTADVYARGEAERVVGAALRSTPRHRFVLSTKCFFPMSDDANDRGLSKKHVTESCEASLKRLGAEYVDLYLCHRWDPDTPIEETLRAMEQLLRAGKILYWGFSQWTAEQIAASCAAARAMGIDPPIADQARYHLLDRGIEAGVVAACEREGIGVLAYSPLAQGVLTGKYANGEPPAESRASDAAGLSGMQYLLEPGRLAKVERLRSVAAEAGMPLARMALAWCLANRAVSAVVIGAKSVQQVLENAQAAEVELAAETLRAIEQAVS